MVFQALIIFSVIWYAAVLAWNVLNWVWFRPKRLEKLLREQGYRGNPYKILHGDFKEMSKMYQEAYSKPINLSDDIAPRIVPPHFKCLQKYGKKSYLWFGPEPAVILMDPDLIKEVANKFEQFPKPNSNPLTKYINQGLVSYEGEKWVKHRKLLNPAFHVQELKLMLPAFYESVSEMLSKWENIASEEVDVWPYLQALTCDVISRTAFGSSYEQGRKIFELLKQQVKLYVQEKRTLYIPGSRFLPTKKNRRMKQISQEVDSLVTELINERLKSMKSGKWNHKDMLGILLESINAQETGMSGNTETSMTMKDVIKECKLFYFAGQETTSSVLVWTMFLLCRFPDWQSLAREEVLQILGNSSMPDFDKLNQLKIVSMILNEVMRVYSGIDFTRRTVKETTLGDLTLPAGVHVILPILLMHHDASIWGDDVKEFKPERFVDGASNAMKGKGLFFPFGWGPRICIGQHFAMLEAKLAVAMILQRFSFELSQSYTHAPYTNITIQPQYGVQLILHKL